MDERKKPESSGDEVERLGPYRLEEQMPQDGYSRGALYRATHETSGVPTLVYQPAAEDEAGSEPLPDMRGRYVSSSSPGYIAVEMEQAPTPEARDRHSVEMLVLMFEKVHEGVRRMARAFPDTDEPCPPWRLGLALAGSAGVCALVCALVHLLPVSPPPSGPEPVASASPAPMSQEGMPEPFTSGRLTDTTPQGEPVLARPLPREPFKGQKRPPCIRYTEVELIGACWMPHRLKAPCPDAIFEHEGECYAPVFGLPPPPQAVEP